MRYLITGGSGFLGFHIIKQLLEQKQEITVLDRDDLPEQNLKKKLRFIKGDARNPEDVEHSLKDVEVVIHAAASLPLESAHQIRTTTVNGTQLVIDKILSQNQSKPKSPIKRMVYISSTAVYGVPIKHPIEETDQLVGVGPYGHAKIDAENICRKYRDNKLVIPIIRPKTFIGTERLGVFQILFNWVRLGKKIPIIGNGQNRYQLLEVEDLVRGILLLSKQTASKGNDEYNIGAQEYQTVHQDITALCEFAGTGSKPLPVPAIFVKPALRTLEAFNLSPLYRWVYDTADKDSFVSTQKIEQLGWNATRSNAESLINAYQWYLKNYDHIEGQSGTTHRVGWDQGALNLIKKFL